MFITPVLTGNPILDGIMLSFYMIIIIVETCGDIHDCYLKN
jgi:hypothetical protein